MIFQSVESVQEVRRLERLLGGDREYISHVSVFLCPIKLDNACRQLSEEEVVEFIRGEAYPQLAEKEGLH